MKKFIRGCFRVNSFSRVLVFGLLACLFAVSASVCSAVIGGRQNIVLLPITNTVENAPYTLAAQVQNQLQVALMQQPGVQVDMPNRKSQKMKLAAAQDEAAKELIYQAYDTAVDPKASVNDRVKASAVLAEKMGMNAVLFGEVDGYSIDRANVTKVRVKVTFVTFEKDSLGKYKVDAQGFIVPVYSTYLAVGQSTTTGKTKITQTVYDSEAVNASVGHLVQQIFDNPEMATPQATKPATKKSKTGWIWVALGVAALAALAGAGGGGGSSTPIIDDTPIVPTVVTHVNALTYSIATDSLGSKYNVRLTWDYVGTKEAPVPDEFLVYRGEGLAISRGFNGNAFSYMPVIKLVPGRIRSTTRSASGRGVALPTTRPGSMAIENSRSMITSVVGNKRVFVDTEVEAGKSYSYVIVAKIGNTLGAESDPIIVNLAPSTREVRSLTANANAGVVSIGWEAPEGAVGLKYKVYRSATIPTSGTPYATFITKSDLNSFTYISNTQDPTWINTAFVDQNPTPDRWNSYVVVPCDINNIPSPGPYPIVHVKVTALDWIGTIYDASVSVPTLTQRVYYSVDSADLLSKSSNLSTDLIFTAGLTSNGMPAGARVIVKTDRGSFVPSNSSQTLIDSKTLSGVLDSSGQMVVIYQGRAEDTARSTYLSPNANELGQPIISATCNGVAIASITGTYPQLVGPPHTVTLSWDVPVPTVPQPDGIDVLFQDTSMTLNANVKDRIGQTVMAGMPIWFVQSWTPLTTQTVATPAYFSAALGHGTMERSTAYTDANGTATTSFTSNYSGKFTLNAYALRGTPDTDSLTAVNTNNNGGLTETVYTAVKQNLLPLNSATGGDVKAFKDVICKTYAGHNKWYKKSVSKARVNCSDAAQSSTISFYAEDEYGKRVLPGVFYQVRPFRVTGTGTVTTGRLQNAGDNGVLQTTFNELGETSFIIRGDQTIGQIYLEFNSMMKSQPNTQTADPVVTMYGPYLNEAIDLSYGAGNPANAAIYMDIPATEKDGVVPVVKPYLQHLRLQDNADLYDQFDITVTLRDASGNRFPAGYLIAVASQNNSSMNSGAPFSAYGETNTSGEFTFTYHGAVLHALGLDELIDSMVFTVYGENAQGADVRSSQQSLCTPGYPAFTSNTTVKTVHPSSTSPLTIFVQNSGSISYKAEKYRVSLNLYTDEGVQAWNRYPVTFELSCIDEVASIVASSEESGYNSWVDIKTNEINGAFRITAFYDYNGDGKFNQHDYLLGQSGQFTIGGSTPFAIYGLRATAIASNQINVNWTEIPGVDEYLVRRTNPSNPGELYQTTVDENALEDIEDLDEGHAVASGTTYVYQIMPIVENAPPDVTIDWSYPVQATTFPNVPVMTNVSVVPRTYSTSISWTSVTGADYYLIQRMQDGATNAWIVVGTVPSTTLTYTDSSLTLMPNTKYHYRVLASATPYVTPNISIPEKDEVVTMPPAVPGLSAAGIRANSSYDVTLSWLAGAGADGYNVYFSPDNIQWNQLANHIKELTYNHAGLLAGQTYYYRVSAVNADGQESPYSTVVNVTTFPSAPTSTSASPVSTTAIRVNWTEMPGANYYVIERTTDAWVSMTRAVADDSANGAYLDSGLEPGVTYTYRVWACSTTETSTGSMGSEASTNTYPIAPLGLRVTKSSLTGTELTWYAVDGATSYRVERTSDLANPWNAIGDTDKITFTDDDNLLPVHTYHYRVCAVIQLANGAKLLSDYSNIADTTTPPVAPIVTATVISGRQVNLNWDFVPNANWYIVEKSIDGGTNWITIGQPQAVALTLPFPDTSCMEGSTVTYRVWACLLQDTDTGSPSTPVTVTTQLPLPTGLTATATSTTSITLSWTATQGATGYYLERRALPSGSWSTVNNGNPLVDTTFIDDNLIIGSSYEYRLTAFNATETTDPSPVVTASTFSGASAQTYSLALGTNARQRIYYSADPDDAITSGAPTSTTIVVTSMRYSNPANPNADEAVPVPRANVTLVATRGYFIAKSGQTVDATGQRISGLTDNNGQMPVTFVGKLNNGVADQFKVPTTSELGVTTFNLYSNGSHVEYLVGRTFGESPILIGTPSDIATSVSFPDPPIGVPDQPSVLYQNNQASVTATVKDACGNPVLDGTPIWFNQYWTKLESLDPTVVKDYNNKVVAFGTFSNEISLVSGDNGQATTLFSSNHSGLYNIRAAAILPLRLINSQVLLNAQKVDGGVADESSILSSISPYLLKENGGTIFSEPKQVLNKTFVFGNRWSLVSVSHPRINCSGDDSASIVFTARDSDNKRVLPGTYYSVRPERMLNNNPTPVPPMCIISDANNNVITGGKLLIFDDDSLTSFFIRGNQINGELFFEFDNQTGTQRLYHYSVDNPSPLTFYGPSLYTDLPKDEWHDDDSIVIMNNVTNNLFPRIAGQFDNTIESFPKSVIVTIRLHDRSKNSFPAGYRVWVDSSVNFNSNSVPYKKTIAEGETDANGYYTFEYKAPPLGDVNYIKDVLTVHVRGEGVNSSEEITISNDASEGGTTGSNTTIVIERPTSIKFSSDTLTVKNPYVQRVVATFYNQYLDPVSAGYKVSFVISDRSASDLDTSISTVSDTTNVNGAAAFDVNPGKKGGWIDVKATYRDQLNREVVNTMRINITPTP